jgi:hypothetical protein
MGYKNIKIKVKWEVSDGYAGKGRPQETIFKPYDYVDEDFWKQATREEKIKIIEEAVQEDFENKISFSIDDYGI